MTTQVAKSLINYDSESYQKVLAMNFAKEYFNSPNRGYGASINHLFNQMKKDNFNDVLSPALNQFQGRGSFGNGGAMRVSPVSLYCVNKSEDFLVDLVKKTTEITHTHSVGINGAILQALAIHKILKKDPTENFDKAAYLDELSSYFEINENVDEMGPSKEKHFTKQLKEVKRLINKDFEPSNDEVVNALGHSVNALYSVPTALYCFLKNSHLENPLRSLLEYTIGLGGDTDTIASMSLALMGSFHGSSVISPNLVKHCESNEIMLDLADQLYEVSCK